ncbi:MAG: electron transfer flavoprotein subunit beta/FixA family protein [Chloroflexi bacterium]|nr:electron transfer flavoprotein subunit beta/FixA family protein [Chloroflexota bacterium]
MHVVVCIKSVPETTQVAFNPDTGTMIREGLGTIINPFDMYAIEEALRIVERHGGRATVMTMGPPQAAQELREAMAMGCERGVLLSARAFAGADTWATAYTLSAAIRALGGADLVLCGKQAMDGDTGQVGPGIASQLGMAPLTYVWRIREIEPASGRIVVERLLEEGTEIVSAPLPAVVTVLKGINTPRYPTRRGLRRARRTELEVWGPQDLPGIDPECLGLSGSPTQVVRVFSPEVRAGGVRLFEGGTLETAADALAEQLIADRLV